MNGKFDKSKMLYTAKAYGQTMEFIIRKEEKTTTQVRKMSEGGGWYSLGEKEEIRFPVYNAYYDDTLVGRIYQGGTGRSWHLVLFDEYKHLEILPK